jgi:transmembrane sensor
MAGQPDDIDPRAWEQALDWIFEIDRRGDDPAVAAALQSWLAADPEHPRAYRQARQIWDLAPRVRPSGRVPRADLAGPPRSTHGGIGRRRLVLGGALAAGLAALIVGGGWIEFRADYTTRVGERREVALTDGTRLHLNTDSAVRVVYGDGGRKVELLRGEVHFAVMRDEERPFTVDADAARIEVLGTRFNVRKEPAAITIDVEDGVVAASVAGRNPIADPLRRGDRLRIDLATGTAQRSLAPPAAMALWQRGRLVVDGATVAQVLAEIGRYHRGYIILRDSELAARTVSGTYDLTQPVEAARAVVQPFGGRLTQVTPFLTLVAAR